jgi:cytochrome c553
MSCTWCHGTSSPLFATSQITMGTTLSPHGYCGRCHSRSVHGADGSQYPVLKARMINTRADSDIAWERANPTNNNINEVDFNDTSDTGALALGTGYLCGSADCHTGGVTFPVNRSGATPYQAGALRSVTGHRVLAMNTTDWNNDGSYGVVYSAGQTDSPFGGPVAFAPVGACYACHDAQGVGRVKAFPHNYVDNSGAAVAKTALGSSWIWLTVAADTTDTKVVAGKTQTGTTNEIAGHSDGLCLKCHRDGVAGVGISY